MFSCRRVVAGTCAIFKVAKPSAIQTSLLLAPGGESTSQHSALWATQALANPRTLGCGVEAENDAYNILFAAVAAENEIWIALHTINEEWWMLE
eukprot:42474-Amphidinium_carterae.1